MVAFFSESVPLGKGRISQCAVQISKKKESGNKQVNPSPSGWIFCPEATPCDSKLWPACWLSILPVSWKGTQRRRRCGWTPESHGKISGGRMWPWLSLDMNGFWESFSSLCSENDGETRVSFLMEILLSTPVNFLNRNPQKRPVQQKEDFPSTLVKIEKR